ncbi:unnamed protein product [Arctogadus glacialis]
MGVACMRNRVDAATLIGPQRQGARASHANARPMGAAPRGGPWSLRAYAHGACQRRGPPAMSRPLTQLLPPEHPAGASPHLGSSNPTGSAPNGGHLTSMASLKSLLQLPIKADPRAAKDCCEMKDKAKPPDPEEEAAGAPPLAVPAGGPPGAGPLRPSSQSAFLGPLLWERTLPCDGGLFQLQYMDLEEFLTENGMGMHTNGPSSATAQIPSQDDKYWSRRYKNNEAAKRSRDARRLKENQITVRAAFLERENATLRQEVADMRKELGRCRSVLNKYESRHGDL